MSEHSGNNEVYERFLDATAELVMEQYAVSVAEAWDSPAAEQIEIPEALDKRCRGLIRKKLSKERHTRFAKRATRFAVAAMLCVVMLFGVAGILFTTVEAVRIPIINFFISQRDGYIEIGGIADQTIPAANSQTMGTDSALAERLSKLMPEGYMAVQSGSAETDNFAVLYENNAGDSIYFCIDPYDGMLHVDTESVVSTEKLKIGDCNAVLVEKVGYQLLWLDEKVGMVYQLSADALTREEIVDLAKNIGKIR